MARRDLHRWDVSYAEARTLQTELAAKVRFDPLDEEPRRIAGLDCAFSKDGRHILAVVVVLRPAVDWASFELVETVSARQEVRFPYIPGLLSFREAPVCLEAVDKLAESPDVFMVDGQGIAHPRRLGLAAHLGLFLDKPTIGCAKSRLTGTFDEPGLEKGSHSPLRDKDGDAIGAVVRTRTHVKPLFISVGHRCRLEDAIRLTLACAVKYRLPEPTRLAHRTVSQLKQ